MHWSSQNSLEVVLEPLRACTILPWSHCVYLIPCIGSKVTLRSSSMSANLYNDLTIELGMRNYPKMTPHTVAPRQNGASS